MEGEKTSGLIHPNKQRTTRIHVFAFLNLAICSLNNIKQYNHRAELEDHHETWCYFYGYSENEGYSTTLVTWSWQDKDPITRRFHARGINISS